MSIIHHPIYITAWVAALRLGYPGSLAHAYASARRYGFGVRMAMRAARKAVA